MFVRCVFFGSVRKVASSTLTELGKKKMSSSALIQKFNPATGMLEWELQKENYDYIQEVARAGFGDMLHDEERVICYF